MQYKGQKIYYQRPKMGFKNEINQNALALLEYDFNNVSEILEANAFKKKKIYYFHLQCEKAQICGSLNKIWKYRFD